MEKKPEEFESRLIGSIDFLYGSALSILVGCMVMIAYMYFFPPLAKAQVWIIVGMAAAVSVVVWVFLFLYRSNMRQAEIEIDSAFEQLSTEGFGDEEENLANWAKSEMWIDLWDHRIARKYLFFIICPMILSMLILGVPLLVDIYPGAQSTPSESALCVRRG